MWHLLMAHQQESFSPFLPSKVSPAAYATWQKEALQNHMVLSCSLHQNRMVLFLQNWVALFLSPQNLMVLLSYGCRT